MYLTGSYVALILKAPVTDNVTASVDDITQTDKQKCCVFFVFFWFLVLLFLHKSSEASGRKCSFEKTSILGMMYTHANRATVGQSDRSEQGRPGGAKDKNMGPVYHQGAPEWSENAE